MFEKALQEKLEAIFEIEKVTFDMPGETREQDCLFVQIENTKSLVRDGSVHARVTGKGFLFAPAGRLPFGYFAKCIASHPDLSKQIFFFDIEENTRLYENIVQRSFSFVYFFDSQYDPAVGTITSIETEVST